MTYEQIATEAVKEGRIEELSIDIYRFEENGQSIIGKLIKISDYESPDMEKPVNKYVFDTDQGKISCILGAVADAIFDSADYIGCIFCITYQGQKQGRTNRRFNSFKIEKLG